MLEECRNKFQHFLKRNKKIQSYSVKLTFFEIFGSRAGSCQKSRIRNQAIAPQPNPTKGQPTARRASMGPCKCPEMDFVVGAQVWVGALRPFLTGAQISAQKSTFFRLCLWEGIWSPKSGRGWLQPSFLDSKGPKDVRRCVGCPPTGPGC